MNKKVVVSLLSLTVALSIGLPQAQARVPLAPQPPNVMTYQGHLLDATGVPVLDGTYRMAFDLWDAPAGGTLLWGAEPHDVTVQDGFFSVLLGTISPIDPAALDATTYLGITVEGETLLPRQQLASVAFSLASSEAVRAGDADLLEGQTGAYYRDWYSLTNVPPGFADGVDDDTTYTAGTGLSLAGTTFAADTTYLQRRVNPCPLGSSIREINADGTVVCQDVETSLTATYAISSSTAVSSTYAAVAGEVAWGDVTGMPAGFADGVDDDTTYTAGTGLSLAGTTFAADTTYLQRRVNPCPLGSSIREINADGTVVCQDVETSLTATYAISSSTAVSSTYAAVAGEVAWGDVTGMPAGFADGVDDDTTYTAGTGLSLAGDEFSADTGYLQRRVSSSCAVGSSIQEINADGTVVCQDVKDVAKFHRAAPQAVALSPSIVWYDGSAPDITVGDDGRGILAYVEYHSHPVAPQHSIRVGRCIDAECSGVDSVAIDRFPQGTTGIPVITIGSDGLPILAYIPDINGGPLRTAHCQNVSCTQFITSTLWLDNINPFGIAIGSDGLPVIAVRRPAVPNSLLALVHCDDIACTSATIADITDSWGAAIAVGVDGLPIIAYAGPAPAYGIHTAHCADVACSTFVTNTVDANGYRGPGIVIGSDGLPVVTYRCMSTNIIGVAHCDNIACTQVTTSMVTDTSTEAIGGLTVVDVTIGSDGLPVFVYATEGLPSQRHIKVGHCTDTVCSNATISADVGRAHSTTDPSITIGVDGLPLIAFRRDSDLRIAHCSNVFCSNYFRRQ